MKMIYVLLELRLAGPLWSALTMWIFRVVANSLNLPVRIYLESNDQCSIDCYRTS